MNRERVVIVILDLIIGGGDSFRCHLATPDSINELKLFVTEPDISLVELVPDSSPPIFVL